jgi:hypothetical protein
MLSNPQRSFPKLTDLADQFATDRNRVTGNRHGYARVYDQLLASRRLSLRTIVEVGIACDPESHETAIPAVALWHAYFPFSRVVGIAPADLSRFDSPRFSSLVCDPSSETAIKAAAARIAPGSVDVIIDDGSHASADQQLAFRTLFPLLAGGGWYFIEDLDWQPSGEGSERCTLTKSLFREMQQGIVRSLDPYELVALMGQVADIMFFDSLYELERATLVGGLVAIRKCAGRGAT